MKAVRATSKWDKDRNILITTSRSSCRLTSPTQGLEIGLRMDQRQKPKDGSVNRIDWIHPKIMDLKITRATLRISLALSWMRPTLSSLTESSLMLTLKILNSKITIKNIKRRKSTFSTSTVVTRIWSTTPRCSTSDVGIHSCLTRVAKTYNEKTPSSASRNKKTPTRYALISQKVCSSSLKRKRSNQTLILSKTQSF